MNIKNIKLVGIILAVVAALAVLDILGLCDGRGNTQILLFKKPVAGIRKGVITYVHKPIFGRRSQHGAL